MLLSFFQKKIIIFWCIFIVYTSINDIIQGISSIIIFTSNEFTLKQILIQRLICVLSMKFDPCLGSKVKINMTLYEIIPVWIREVPDNLKTQEMCNEAMRIEPYSLAFVPDCSKTQEICDEAFEIDPFILWHVPDHLKMQGMCIRAVEAGLGLLEYVPNWFVTQGQIDLWRDNDYWYDDDKLIE